MAEICPHCGKPVPETAMEGICPECMLKVGMASHTEGPTKMISPPSPEEIAPLFPQLEILECLGRGGMGAVYKARQPKLNRFIALKILAREKEDDPKFSERFEREAQALARLNHPNIVTVYDFGEVARPAGESPLYYLLMEFVDGLSLRQLMRNRKLRPEEALKVVPSICEALQFAHEQGIVHRDIKPENILLDKSGRVKIADFGIAKILGDNSARGNLTAEQQVIGTPHYMAPEQVERPRTVDHRADIFSLGVVFYEMLTGELPLGKFQPPSRKVQADVRLDEVVLHALEKEPDRRYQRASEVKTDVEIIAASPTSAPRKEAAPSKTNRPDAISKFKGALFASAILFGVLSGATLLGWLASNKSFPLPAAFAAVAAVTVVAVCCGVWFTQALAHRSGKPLIRCAKREDSQRKLSGWVNAARWTARVFSVLLIAFYGVAVIAEGLPPIGSQPEGVQLNFVALGLMLGGFIVGWRREGTAALLIASGWTLWHISEGHPRWNVFQTPLPVAMLYAACWWASSGRKTGRLVAAAATLGFALVIGRLFCPTSVFVQGKITDAVSGKPIANAELTLQADSRAGNDSSRPNSRSGSDGSYRLYVGWYTAGKRVTISASGYAALATNLGPRSLGQREVSRNFLLQAEAPSPPPVVVRTIPESGSSDVDPALTEIRIAFSKPMQLDRFGWTFVSGAPETRPGTHRWVDDRTSVLPVRLEPGKLYAIWVNKEDNQKFQDRDGRFAVPYLLIFQTRR